MYEIILKRYEKKTLVRNVGGRYEKKFNGTKLDRVFENCPFRTIWYEIFDCFSLMKSILNESA